MTWITQQDPAKVEANKAKLRAVNWTVASRNWLTCAGGDEDYALWLALCDRRCIRMVMVGIFDLDDWRWSDAFVEGYSPAEAVRECLSDDDLYGSLVNE